MKSFFQCEVRNVYIGGVLIENAMIVTQVRTGTELVANEIEVSEKNKGIAILGMRYNADTDEFENIDVELSQLDRIEQGTNQLLTDIQSQAIDEFTLELMESGLL